MDSNKIIEYSEIKITKDFTLILHPEQQRVLNEIYSNNQSNDVFNDIETLEHSPILLEFMEKYKKKSKKEKLPKKLRNGW